MLILLYSTRIIVPSIKEGAINITAILNDELVAQLPCYPINACAFGFNYYNYGVNTCALGI